MALMPLFFAACSSDDVAGGPVNKSGEDLNKTVEIKLTPGTVTSRTPMTTDVTLDDSLNNVCIVFFEGHKPTSKIVSYQDIDFSKMTPNAYGIFTKRVSTTSKATYAVALANVTENYVSGCATFQDVMNTKADIRSTGTQDGRYSQYQPATNRQYNTGLPMYGEDTIQNDQVLLNLERKVARVRINVKTDFSGRSDGAGFTPTEIFMHNFWNKCKWNEKSGCDSLIKTAESIYISSDYIIMSTGVQPFATLNDPNYAAWATFYVLPWIGSSADLQVVVKGTYTNSLGTSTIYYPVSINGGMVEQNNAYTINITIKGKGVELKDVNDGPLNSSSNLTVNVEVSPWTTVPNIDKTIE
jgi:hypothetical protein